jgi:hypothetical protein
MKKATAILVTARDASRNGRLACSAEWLLMKITHTVKDEKYTYSSLIKQSVFN